MSDSMINWPAVIKHDNEDELIYIESLQQWQQDEEMLLYIFTPRDVLIDVSGNIYSLPDLQQSIDSAKCLGQASTDNIMELVRAHAALSNQCCIEKLGANDISQALAIVRQLSED